MPAAARSASLYDAMTACMTEARVPRQREIEAVAAKMWNEAYRPALRVAWESIEAGSACRARLLRAASLALDPPTYALGDAPPAG